jgi:hypothetical protein
MNESMKVPRVFWLGRFDGKFERFTCLLRPYPLLLQQIIKHFRRVPSLRGGGVVAPDRVREPAATLRLRP